MVRFSLARRLQLRVSALNLEQGYLRVCPYTKSHSLPVAFTWVSWQLKLSTACLKNRRPACAVWALRIEALRGPLVRAVFVYPLSGTRHHLIQAAFSRL